METQNQTTKLPISLLSLLPFVALIVSSLPLLTLHYPQGHDWTFELVRAAEFGSALAHGQLPPYWGENLYGGYGSPIFLFYAPLHMLVSTVCTVLTGSIASGSIFALLFFSLVAVFSMKCAMQAACETKTFADNAASRIAVYFFLLTPYLIGDKLLRNANAEYAALCISPLALCGLFTVGRKPIQGGLILAAGLALTILAHNLTALVIVAFISAGAFVQYIRARKISFVGMFTVSAGLGLGLAAFFWLPALSYTGLVQIDQLKIGKFDFHRQFQPFASLFGYDQFFSAGLLIPFVLVSTAGMFWLAWRRRELAQKTWELFAFVCSLIVLFLLTGASVSIWETVPLLPLFQFPWRMMGPLALFTSLIAGLSFAYLFREKSRKMIILAEIMIFVLCMGNAIPALHAGKPLEEAVSANLPGILSGESVKNNRLPATVLDEYLPRSADPTIWQIRRQEEGPVFRSEPAIQVKVVQDTGTNIILETDDARPSRLHIARWFFPGWRCTVNGEARAVEMNRFGAIDISIPSGLNRVIVHLDPPPLRRMGSFISLASFAVWCIMLSLFTVRHRRAERS